MLLFEILFNISIYLNDIYFYYSFLTDLNSNKYINLKFVLKSTFRSIFFLRNVTLSIIELRSFKQRVGFLQSSLIYFKL